MTKWNKSDTEANIHALDGNKIVEKTEGNRRTIDEQKDK